MLRALEHDAADHGPGSRDTDEIQHREHRPEEGNETGGDIGDAFEDQPASTLSFAGAANVRRKQRAVC